MISFEHTKILPLTIEEFESHKSQICYTCKKNLTIKEEIFEK